MRTIGRRAMFFAAMAVVSLLLYYPTPPEFRWVCLFTASLAGFWGVALAAEDLAGPAPAPRPRRRRVELEPEPESPFAPPPAPGAASR